jgi:hypothetical protein
MKAEIQKYQILSTQPLYRAKPLTKGCFCVILIYSKMAVYGRIPDGGYAVARFQREENEVNMVQRNPEGHEKSFQWFQEQCAKRFPDAKNFRDHSGEGPVIAYRATVNIKGNEHELNFSHPLPGRAGCNHHLQPHIEAVINHEPAEDAFERFVELVTK